MLKSVISTKDEFTGAAKSGLLALVIEGNAIFPLETSEKNICVHLYVYVYVHISNPRSLALNSIYEPWGGVV
jgi:hypothetical protein